METNWRQSKVDLVWASLFLAVFAMWGLTVIVFGQVPGLQFVAAALAVGLLVSLIAVSVLLWFSGAGPGLLVAGRLLVCLQLLCHIAAVVMGVSLMLRMG